MKRFYSILAVVLFASGMHAQAPQKMSYQAVVRNSGGDLVTNQSIGVKISILQGSPTGDLVWTETCNPNPQTNANGLVSIEIGASNPLSVDWSSGGPYFLKTETDPAGGTDYTIVGTSQLLSVPYALHSETAASYTETDPIWTSVSTNYYSKTNMQTSGGSQLHFNNITDKPTTIAGYGITNAMSTSHPANVITSLNITDWTTAFNWGDHSGLYRPIGYVPGWSEITSKPTTLAGYGITNAMSTSHPANVITSANITEWTTAFNWGDHSGLYRPIDYVPGWTEITNKPTTISGYGITDAVTTSGNQNISGDKIFLGNILATNGLFNNLTVSAIITSTGGANFTGTVSGITSTMVGLGDVENTALSTWTGSANITTLGTISSGTWHGTAINASYVDNLAASKITSGIFDNARINWAAPGAIGSTTASSGIFNGLMVSNGAVIIKPSGNGGTSGQVLTTDGSGNATWAAPGGGSTHYLGEEFDGGIVFYIYKGSDGLEHGLIVSKTETTADWQWPIVLVNANRTEDGAYNTSVMTDSPAKTWVTGLGAGWYLPSIDELSLLWHCRYHVNKTARAIGSTLLSTSDNVYYWSSTEYDTNNAFYVFFLIGNPNYQYKGAVCNVRAVRAF